MKDAATAYSLAMKHFQQGQLAQADAICERINRAVPQHAEAWHLRGIIAGVRREPKRVEEFVRQAISLKADEPQFHYNLANAYQQLGKFNLAQAAYEQCLRLSPQHLSSLRNLGLLFLNRKNFEAAENCFRKAAEAAPDNAGPWMSLGIAYQQRGDIESAAKCFRKATKLQPQLAEAHMNLGLCLAKRGSFSEATHCYKQALHCKPQLLDAKLNLAIAYQELGNIAAAEACFAQATREHPGEIEPLIKLGTQLCSNAKPKQAIEVLQAALSINPNEFRGLFQIGHAYRQMHNYETAAEYYQRSHRAEPNDPLAMAYLLTSRMEVCDWRDYPSLVAKLQTAFRRQLNQFQADLAEPVRTVSGSSRISPQPAPLHPFMALTLPIESTASEQLQCARAWVHESLHGATDVGVVVTDQPAAAHSAEKLTLGYLSADFKEHPVARLMVELIELHDRNRFRVEGFSLCKSDKSPLRTRLESAFDVMHDCHHRSHGDIASLIRRRNVDILIDLTGYTHGNQPRTLAQRPAAIQVNYLGYPGTMGADYIDYIIVDKYVVPADQQPHYSERLVTLPVCYQVNDRQRLVDGQSTTRDACGLPCEGFVFCCFNNNLKITPEQFYSWMRILRRVPESVLWLLQNSPPVTRNLQQSATQCGVSPERLRFAPRTDQTSHLARHQHANLFLDTLPYNAHTTASDALWCGVPLVTRSGPTFQSRVAGSLLQAVGLPELIVASPTEYEDLCVELAMDPHMLESLRNRLLASRSTSPLWNTSRFASDLERAYETMWDRFQCGQPVQPIVVKSD